MRKARKRQLKRHKRWKRQAALRKKAVLAAQRIAAGGG